MPRTGFANILMVHWALVALPMVCETGVMEHLCQCVLGSVCEHESECESDPCNVVVIRLEHGPHQDLPTAGVCIAAAAAFDLDEAAAFAGGSAALPSDPNLPFAPSDRPLRI